MSAHYGKGSGEGPQPELSRTWFGHPRGLTILFLTEMWSDFSFFGMRTLLIYYMTQQLMISQQRSSLIYGLYTSFVYFTPLIGGTLSDRWLGRQRAVLLGGGIMALGHFMMAFEPLFYVALATIAIGNGLFLPSLASQINLLYSAQDPRMTSAYNIYYIGINVGSFLAPFACGTIGELYGWHWGFTLAGIGMATGMAVYVAGRRYLPHDSRARPTPADSQSNKRLVTPDKNTYYVLGVIFLLVILFRTAYEQVGNTVALWADIGVNRSLGNFNIPMTWFQALNPMGIFMFTPGVVAFWTLRAKQGHDRGPIVKMAIGAFIVAGAYVILAMSSMEADSSGTRTSWLWLTVYFIVFTLGEIFILPVGLGLFGRLAPANRAATMIAAWFAAAFFGNLTAGAVGTLWSSMRASHYFALVAGISSAAGILLLLLALASKRLTPNIASAHNIVVDPYVGPSILNAPSEASQE